MPNPDFTVAQARDLARHFLGPQWKATFDNTGHCFLGDGAATFLGPNWRTAFRAAGVKLPFRPRFVGIDQRVVLGNENVAVATSRTMAARIAKALNDCE